MMTKRNFIALADYIREHNRLGDTPFVANQLDTLADFCRNNNHRFDRERWFDYIRGECGPSGGAIRRPKGEMTAVEADRQDSSNSHCGCRECCGKRNSGY